MRVALAGATGLVGNYCLQFLLESPEIDEVWVLTRRALKQSHPKIKMHIVDFSKLDQLFLPKTTLDAVICCLGTTIKQAGSRDEFKKVDLEYVLALAHWGIKYKAQHFLVVSSMGANENSSIFYNQIKGRMETAISKMDYRSVSIFRPSLLVGPREKLRLGEKLGEGVLKFLSLAMQGPLRKYRAISAERVARAMVSVMAQGETGTNIYLSDKIEQMSDA
jgi:uncharacterized protein YbjT (DUF2867 family)